MFVGRKIFIIWLLGVISGFTLMISGNTLNYWLAKEELDIRTIGIFAFILLPYSVNFIWSPIFDTKKIKFLSDIFGDRLSWICIIQWLLILSILVLSFINPTNNLFRFALSTLFIAFFSSTQDALLGALRTELIEREKQGEVAGIHIFGYRIGMLLSGSVAIYLSAFLSFAHIYQYFALMVFIQNIILIFTVKNFKNTLNHSVNHEVTTHPISFLAKLLKPVGSIHFIMLTIIFLIFYRLPDNFINIMINPFLINLGFDAIEIAGTGKLCGIIGAIIGGFAASHIMKKKKIIDSLLIFGIIHAFAHVFFIILEYYGHNSYLLFLVIAAESITGGMSMAAYIAFITSLCHGRFRATQYSFFSAIMGFSRAVFPAASGYMVNIYGWKIFFFFTSIATIPALIILIIFKKYVKNKVLEA